MFVYEVCICIRVNQYSASLSFSHFFNTRIFKYDTEVANKLKMNFLLSEVKALQFLKKMPSRYEDTKEKTHDTIELLQAPFSGHSLDN